MGRLLSDIGRSRGCVFNSDVIEGNARGRGLKNGENTWTLYHYGLLLKMMTPATKMNFHQIINDKE